MVSSVSRHDRGRNLDECAWIILCDDGERGLPVRFSGITEIHPECFLQFVSRSHRFSAWIAGLSLHKSHLFVPAFLLGRSDHKCWRPARGSNWRKLFSTSAT